HSFPLKVTSSE
ncbi:incFII family plasmid replication initiator RepA, partial [Escherichia coli NE037]